MREFSLRQRIRYWFDSMMARGTIALIIWLGALATALVLGVSFLVTTFQWAPVRDGGARPGYWEIAWMSLLRTLDPGTMGNDTGSWPFLLSMLGVTIAGIFVVGTLIGLLTTAIDRRLDELRKGRSPVIERDHIVLLGWSVQIHTLVRELVMANAQRRYNCIAILAERDQVEMEDDLRARAGAPGRTRLVCRTGSQTDRTDLLIVHPEGARAFVVLPDETPASDARVTKTLLALNALPRRPVAPIIASVRDPEQARIARLVGGLEAKIVVTDEMIARVIAQTARNAGLAAVYVDLLDFSGNNIHFLERPELAGRTFDEVLSFYDNAVPIGICGVGGDTRLNPPGDTRFAAGERVILLAVDPTLIERAKPAAIDEAKITGRSCAVHHADRVLVLGWNRRAVLVLKELHRYSYKGSLVTVVTDHPGAVIAMEHLHADLPRIDLKLHSAAPGDRSVLDGMGVGSYRSVIVLPDSDRAAPDDADAATLVTLLHLRDIARHAGAHNNVVSEVLDARNRALAEQACVSDAIVSDKLVSLMLAQLAENPQLEHVLDEIFDAEGCDMRMLHAEHYVPLDETISFADVIEAARRRGEIAIGYRRVQLAGDADQAYGVKINPRRCAPLRLTAGDRLIVLGRHASSEPRSGAEH